MAKNYQTIFNADPGKQEIFISREFDAPRDIVFKAFTDPKLFVQWLGPRDLSLKLEKFEPRNGGMWRYVHTDKNGKNFAFHGVYHEVLSPERIIQTFEYEGLSEAGHVILDIAKFEALPTETTKLTEQSIYLTVADRDGMIQADMFRGVNESYERLDELLLQELKKIRMKVEIT